MERKSRIQQLEEAAGISPETYKMPYGKGEVIKSGDIAREWTGPRPWRNNSTKGSAPFSNAELKQGYRKVK